MLIISPTLHEEVIRHCRTHYPKEACGLLAGEGDTLATGGELRAVAVYPMTNVEDSAIGYAMDPQEQLRAAKEMRQKNQHLIGIYHSHTASAAYPSSVDVSFAVSPDIAYVLVSLKDPAHPDFKSYRIDGGTLTSEDVRVI